MKVTELFTKTSKQAPSEEISVNAKLLSRAGYIDKVAAGIYTFLPLGQRVLDKITKIVREEMDAAGGQEISMPVLHPKENWQKTGRWESLDVLFKVKGKSGEFAMGATHEEIVAPLAKKYIASYADLPKALYQIQTKFRDEPRAKSGILRGREFLMKDLYSFHKDEADLEKYYEEMKKVYGRVFGRLGLDAILTEASGGTFSKYSHEFQVLCETGEDTIYYCKKCRFARNKEVIEDLTNCPNDDEPLTAATAAEVGNIFKLATKYSEPFDLSYTDRDGSKKLVVMGCYGIGISRLMGTIVEVYHDEAGIIWPKQVSPFDIHLVHVEDTGTEPWAVAAYGHLTKAGIQVLWDDRGDVSAGEKFADADLIGIPVRLVVSKKVGEGKVEWKERDKKEIEVIDLEEAVKRLKE